MTTWMIRRCPNIVSAFGTEHAILDDEQMREQMRGLATSWVEAWKYLAEHVAVGDTVTVLADYGGDTWPAWG